MYIEHKMFFFLLIHIGTEQTISILDYITLVAVLTQYGQYEFGRNNQG
jgi:hypothetical protein